MLGNGIYLARRDSTIVAGIAVVDAAGIVFPGAAGEGCGSMTDGTVPAGRNMVGYGIHHPRRRGAVMAGSAIIGDTAVIEGRRFEATGVMADTAVLRSRNMAGNFRRGETCTVAG